MFEVSPANSLFFCSMQRALHESKALGSDYKHVKSIGGRVGENDRGYRLSDREATLRLLIEVTSVWLKC